MTARQGFDWNGLLRLGLVQLKLHPAEFWALTPAEFLLMLGPAPVSGALTASGLEALAARFPDADDGESHG